MSVKKIYPNLACRLEFFVEDSSTGLPVPSLSYSDVSSAGYALIDDGVRASTVSVSLSSSAADTAAVAAGKFITINSSRGHYAIDCPSGASDSGSQFVEAVVAFTAGHMVYAVTHEINYELAVAINTSADVSATSTAVTTVDGRVQDVQSRIPAALVSGRMDASVGAMATNTFTASAIATDAGTELASAVRTNLATELTRIDVAISTRLASASYTTPPSTGEILTALGTGTWITSIGDSRIANLDTTISSRATQTTVNEIASQSKMVQF